MNLIGKTITGIRWQTEDEADVEGWDWPAVVVELDDGSLVYPSSDDEGNNRGALFGMEPTGEGFYVSPEE